MMPTGRGGSGTGSASTTADSTSEGLAFDRNLPPPEVLGRITDA
jgi:hypothetical protein